MKHVFIVNPNSGSGNSYELVNYGLKTLFDPIDHEIYVTKSKGDAVNYIKDYMAENREYVRFYACGGDGTINEVVNGIVSFPNASFTVFPSGSGNDFIKTFGKKEDFTDFYSLVNGNERPIDLIKVGERYCVNVCNFGLDSFVAGHMDKIRSKPIIGGRNSYKTSVALGFAVAMKTKATVFADGRKVNDGTLLLCTVANAQYVGGKYKCAPRAVIDDGLLELCLVKPISRLTFLRLSEEYAKGNHLDDERFKKHIIYKQCKSVEVFAEKEFGITLDGEVHPTKHEKIDIIHNGIKFAVPDTAHL